MNAIATLPSAGAGHSGAAAEGKPAGVAAADSSSSVLRSLFLLLLSDLLQPQAEQNGEAAEKKEGLSQEDCLVAPAGVPVPVPLPMLMDPIAAPVLPAFGEPQPEADRQTVVGSQEGRAPAPGLATNHPVADAWLLSSRLLACPNISSPPSDSGPRTTPDPRSASPTAEGPAVSNPDVAAAPPDGPLVCGMSQAQTAAPVELFAAAPPAPVANSLRGTSPADVQTVMLSQPSGGPSDLQPKPAETQSKTWPDVAQSPEPAQSTAFRDAVVAPHEIDPGHPPEPDAVSIRVERPARLSEPAIARPAERAALSVHPEAIAELAFVARLVPEAKETAHPPGLNAQAPGVPDRGESTSMLPPVEQKGTDSRTASAPPPAARTSARTLPESDATRPDDPLPLYGQVQPGATPATAARDAAVASPQPQRPAPAAEPRHTSAVPPSGPPPSPLLPARDIRLQVSGTEQHVDVRLTERGGQIQVAVRTPDPRLTEALRSDLPALSARLEQSGFRAETWHPAASRTEHLGAAAPGPASSGSSPQGQPGGRQGAPQDREAPPRRAPVPEPKTRPDSSPKEFSWLFASFR